MVVNYSNGKVYIIRSYKTNKVYIGSTAKKYLSDRFSAHNSLYKRYLREGKGYTLSFEILKYEDAYIELLENVECKNVYELKQKEQYWINEYQLTCVNKFNPVPPDKPQTYYYHKHRLRLLEQNKKWFEENKERNDQYKREWAQKNKDRIKKRKKEKYTCGCGRTITKQIKAQHERTMVHRLYVLNIHNIFNHL